MNHAITVSLPMEEVEFLQAEKSRTGRSMSGILSDGLRLYRGGPAKPAAITSVAPRILPPTQQTPPTPVVATTMVFPPNHPLYKPPIPVDTDSRDEARNAYDDLHPPKPPFDEWYATQRALGAYP
jgi:hypothetical protein